MKIKWNWGTGAISGLIMLMLMIVGMVIRMSMEDISLVEKDYYPKGQAHQEMIDKVRNTIPYASSIEASVENGLVVVSFPAFFRPDAVKGTVHIYHRVTDSKDILVPLQLDKDGVFAYPSHEMRGRYILKIDWNHDGEAYYTEKSIVIE